MVAIPAIGLLIELYCWLRGELSVSYLQLFLGAACKRVPQSPLPRAHRREKWEPVLVGFSLAYISLQISVLGKAPWHLVSRDSALRNPIWVVIRVTICPVAGLYKGKNGAGPRREQTT